MKRIKQIIGILLIIFAVAALVYWEVEGRSRIVTEKVVVASKNIVEGQVITRQELSVVNAMPETVIPGAFSLEELYKIEGKQASQDIVQNQQIAEHLLREPIEIIKDKRSPYVVKPEWIDSRSSSLRRGDIVNIYSRDGSYHVGDFEIAFVKDVGDKEVIDMAGEDGRFGGQISDVRSRLNSSGIINHLEILAELADYRKILQFIDDTGETLLIVQKGD